MLSLDQTYVNASGGVLSALANKCSEYLQGVIRSSYTPPRQEVVERLERVIVHTEPHLDEYFAELLFRACLPPDKWRCDFVEQSIFSATNDLGCKHLWPAGAVLGIGSTAGGGVQPLFLFDEHVSGQTKIAASCSQVVAEKMLNGVPPSVAQVLREVNVIDEFGGGHPQSLNNLIKTLHEVRFWFGKNDSDGTQIRDALSPQWKRSVIDACLTAVVYCLENSIDLAGGADAKKASLAASLDNYVAHSPHASHARFKDAEQRVRSIFGDQAKVFQDAVLKDRNGPIAGADGRPVPQLLAFGRVCFACQNCWGPQLRDIIATHFWEGEFQKQLNFYAVEDAIEMMFDRRKSRAVTPVGTITRDILPAIEILTPPSPYGGKRKRRMAEVWVVTMTPASGVFKPNQAIANFINKHNDGCGMILIRDATLGTSVLFKGSGIPDAHWQRIVTSIKDKEDECWHVIHNTGGAIAPFIVNGNKAHQYVPRSRINSDVLVELVKRTFYN